MKILSKLFAVFVLVCAVYFATNQKIVVADEGCSGNTCQRCQCQYNNCKNGGTKPETCDDKFLFCINGDYTCKKPGSGEDPIDEPEGGSDS